MTGIRLGLRLRDLVSGCLWTVVGHDQTSVELWGPLPCRGVRVVARVELASSRWVAA